MGSGMLSFTEEKYCGLLLLTKRKVMASTVDKDNSCCTVVDRAKGGSMLLLTGMYW